MTKEQIVQLVVQYLPVVLTFLMLVISFCTKGTQKKVVKSQAFLNLLTKLPELIIVAENKGFKTGADKLKYVIELASVILSSSLNITIEEAQDTYKDFITENVETILDTPMKKGE